MTAYNDNTLERQLSSLFRAQAQDAYLPLGTWQTISPKMGEPDGPSLIWQLLNAFSFPRRFQGWRNPLMRVRQVRYAAPVATIVIALLIALLFILLVNDDADSSSPVPAVSPTVPTGPTEPPPTQDLAATVQSANDSATATAQAQSAASPQAQVEGVVLSEGQWVEVSEPPNPRFTHQLISLDDGRVLSVGGRGPDGPVLVADIYDLVTNTWTSAAPLSQPREQAAVVKMANGHVMVTGGEGLTGSGTSSVEIFDPESGVWRNGTPMIESRYRHLAITLDDGRILVSGGILSDEQFARDETGGGKTSSEVYDPVTDSWTKVGERRFSPTIMIPGFHLLEEDLRMVQLPDGRVLAPSVRTTEVEYWDPVTGEWSLAQDLPESTFEEAEHVWVQQTTGRIVVNSFQNPRILNLETGAWDVIDRGSVGPSEVVDGGDGRIVIPAAQPLNELGLLNLSAPLPSDWRVLDPVSKLWDSISGPPSVVELPEYVAIRPGMIIQIGGRFNPVQYEDKAYILQLPLD